LILELQQVNLAIRGGSVYLLEDINFSVKQGEKLAIVGASGAGKTTLLRLLNRLQEPTTGDIYFQGKSIKELPVISLRQQIVLMLQESKLLGMNVKDSLAYPLKLKKLPLSEIGRRTDYWTSLLKIPEQWFERREVELSLGQRQLVAITRALLLEPSILLLDEPTSALDTGTASRLLEVLNNQADLTIIMVNHQLDFLQEFAERVIYLEEGKIIRDMPANQLDWLGLKTQLIDWEKSRQSKDWED
jgi:D-methionine transport system ATP-binding protein